MSREKLPTSVRLKYFLPGRLRKAPYPEEFVASSHLFAQVPCTRYWHWERQTVVEEAIPPGIPWWLSRFDWVVGFAHGWADTQVVPRSVFCHPGCLDGLRDFLLAQGQSMPMEKGSILVTGGEDTRLSTQKASTVRELSRYFSEIYYEAKDCNFGSVRLMPIGLQEFYLRGVEGDFRHWMDHCPEKKERVLAAWGAWWPHLNETIPDRRAAFAFAQDHSFVETGVYPRREYLERVATSRFLLCPRGNGVQAPKLIEALLLGCLPICTRHTSSAELQSRGMPLVLVDRWEELTPQRLESEWENHREALTDFQRTLRSLDRWWSFSFPGAPPNPSTVFL